MEPVKIGEITIDSKLALAPMAGVGDIAFRSLCREFGAGLTCTEMVSAKALCYQDAKTRTLRSRYPAPTLSTSTWAAPLEKL